MVSDRRWSHWPAFCISPSFEPIFPPRDDYIVGGTIEYDAKVEENWHERGHALAMTMPLN